MSDTHATMTGMGTMADETRATGTAVDARTVAGAMCVMHGLTVGASSASSHHNTRVTKRRRIADVAR